eukprot:m.148414 g.148414  ORF g.148414 m.148414 type:complete len:334 (+) comp30593_c0_seq1:132-1133(+)
MSAAPPEEYGWIRNRMIRAALVNISEEKSNTLPGTEMERLGSRFAYTFNFTMSRIKPELRSKFILNSCDTDMKDFLNRCEDSKSFLALCLHATVQTILKPVASVTMINGLLHRGTMWILSTEQFRKHICPTTEEATPFNSLLDIGAGDGNVTAQLAKLFSGKVYATEYSAVMQWRLRMKGYECLSIDGWHTADVGPFDVISCFNVLDRCDEPTTLLEQMRDNVTPVTGRVLLAVVLPFNPFVEVGSSKLKPKQKLKVDNCCPECGVNSLVKNVFEPLGFQLESYSRAPYLCDGDMLKPYYLLHDYMFCLSVPATTSNTQATQREDTQSNTSDS